MRNKIQIQALDGTPCGSVSVNFRTPSSFLKACRVPFTCSKVTAMKLPDIKPQYIREEFQLTELFCKTLEVGKGWVLRSSPSIREEN